jgi:Ca2+-binding RTX toxin-like protein
MSVLSVITPYNPFSPNTAWWLFPSQVSGDGYFPGVFSEAQSSSTRVVFILPDGTKTIVSGTGLNGILNSGWTSLTGIKHVNSDESVTYESVEGFVPAAGVGNGLPINLGLYGLFMDGADTLVGTSSPDYLIGDNIFAGVNNGGPDSIWGGGGADVLRGGAGDDVFRIEGGDFVSGENIEGGFGNDELQFVNAGNVDLRDGVLSSIERYRFQSGVSEITINDSVVFGPTFDGGTISPTVIGSAGTDTIRIMIDGNRTPPLELPITFVDWSPEDRIVIQVAFGRATTGTSQNDFIIGSSLADSINGGGGSDSLSGGEAADTLRGGAGADLFIYSNQTAIDSDLIDGGAEVDGLVTEDGVATYDFTLAAFASTVGNAIEYLNIYNQTTRTIIFDASQFGNGKIATDLLIIGDDGAETVAINNASNFSAAAFEFDFDFWDAAIDRIVINGGTGNDIIVGSSQADSIGGGAGADNLYGGLGADAHNGGSNLVGEIDYARYDDANHGNLRISLATPGSNTGAAAGDTYVGIEGVVGGAGNDTITGDGNANVLVGLGGKDFIYGGGGNDKLKGKAGADNLYGGAGADKHEGDSGVAGEIDYARYDDANHGNLVINLANPALNTGVAAGDTYLGIEGLVGGAGDDTITGDAAANRLWGFGGTDRLTGGLGNDTLYGGSGVDRFYFNTALNAVTNVDVIADFSTVDDFLMLDDAIFTAIGATGFLTAARFITVATGGNATTTAQRIIYEQTTGKLFYDADGSAGGAKVHFATVTAGTALTAGDFYVY